MQRSRRPPTIFVLILRGLNRKPRNTLPDLSRSEPKLASAVEQHKQPEQQPVAPFRPIAHSQPVAQVWLERERAPSRPELPQTLEDQQPDRIHSVSHRSP